MRFSSVTPASRAYVRPTVCMTPWQFESRNPPSLQAVSLIARTAARGSSLPATSARNSRA